MEAREKYIKADSVGKKAEASGQVSSNVRESELVKNLAWESVLRVFGGPVLLLVTFYFLSKILVA